VDPGRQRIVDRVVAAGLTAPTVAELEGGADAANALRRAAEDGTVVAVSREWYVSAAALAGLADTLRELGERGPITVAAVRERLGLSRKYLIPLLEWADRSGVTIRQGDVRLLPRRRA
jgi:selenocysteine-specific elongation factor